MNKLGSLKIEMERSSAKLVWVGGKLPTAGLC